jgi:Ca2+-binding RTX toxin-like protein
VTLTQPANGTAQLNNDGTVTYTPNPDFNGTDQFIYVVSDGFSYSLPATVTITVQPVNDAPTIAVAAGGRCMSDGSPSGTIFLTAGDIDSSVSGLTLHVVSNSNTRLVPNANIVFGVINGSTRSMSISAAPKQKGSAAITVGVTDSAGATSTLVVTVFVGADKDDKIDGTNGADMIFGLNGKNALNGKDGNDLICGGNSIDTISGGNGDDTLVGENGNDQLTGGHGADSFSGGLGTDIATDFTPDDGDTKDATVEIP